MAKDIIKNREDIDMLQNAYNEMVDSFIELNNEMESLKATVKTLKEKIEESNEYVKKLAANYNPVFRED
jgi:archaellum component FlaC